MFGQRHGFPQNVIKPGFTPYVMTAICQESFAILQMMLRMAHDASGKAVMPGFMIASTV
jgi:hypothetical protein